MGGGDAAAAPSYPPPVDYSAAMAYQSDNNKTIAMGQIMAQQFAMQQASMDRQMQIAANVELGLEKLDTKLQIAKLNYIQFMNEEENRHEEKMTEIGAEMDAARGGEPSTQEVTDFLADSGGGYAPGGIWGSQSEFVNDSRRDFGAEFNQLLENDKAQSENNSGLMSEHEQARTDQLDDYYNTTSPDGDADGDGIPNKSDFGQNS